MSFGSAWIRTAARQRIKPFAAAVTCIGGLLCAPAVLQAEPIPMKSAEATFQSGDAGALAHVIDDIEAGPQGWSVGPVATKPQALVIRCAKPEVATELDITLFFLSGRARCSIAEFDLAYTTDAEPSLNGNWEPLVIQRYAAEMVNLSRLENGHLSASAGYFGTTGTIPDDTYRLVAQLPGGRATGFRLRAFPLLNQEGAPYAMSLSYSRDFVLTEFRVEEHVRSTTNIALHCPAKSSHPLYLNLRPEALTDGLPATIAHPLAEQPDPEFHFDIDLGRSVALDHINLVARTDEFGADRFSQILIRLYEDDPDQGAKPMWTGMDRADGSHPGFGEHDTLRPGSGSGEFSGRYLRLSTESKVPLSPQLAEVEAYESRTLEPIAVYADGKELSVAGGLDVPPRVKRLSLQFRIPQIGMPRGDLFRWRIPGDQEEWQVSRMMRIDIPCPPPGRTVFEAQALHSDREWDATVFQLPIIVRQHIWETLGFRIISSSAVILGVAALSLFFSKRRSARQLALAKAQAALAEERTRIARDLHDDLGANLARIGLLTEIAGRSIEQPERARLQLEKIYQTADDLTRQLRTAVWAVDPANDTLENFVRYLHGYAEDYLGMAGIRCHFINTERMPDLSLSSAVRHPLLMIAKEALHNVVKHAAASVVTLRVFIEGPLLVLEVADNGRGLPPVDSIPSGNGLNNMRTRAAALGATCDILPASPGPGTLVRLSLPIGAVNSGRPHPSSPPNP